MIKRTMGHSLCEDYHSSPELKETWQTDVAGWNVSEDATGLGSLWNLGEMTTGTSGCGQFGNEVRMKGVIDKDKDALWGLGWGQKMPDLAGRTQDITLLSKTENYVMRKRL